MLFTAYKPCLPIALLFLPLLSMARPYPGVSGLVASADSARTAGTNPAGITRLGDERSWRADLYGIASRSTWESEVGELERSSRSSTDLLVPALSLVQPLSENWFFGFTFLGVGYSDDLGDWPGRYFLESYDSVTVSAFPSIAYRINDRWSVAASLSASYSRYEQDRAVANLFDPGLPDGSASLDVDGFDVGFGLSLLYEYSDRTRWGLAYLSEQNPEMDGKVKYSGLGPNTESVLLEAGVIGSTVEVRSVTPQTVTAGVYHEFPNNHAFTVDLAWSDFSSFELSEFYVDGEQLTFNETAWEDTLALSASYSWPVSPRWMLGVSGLYVDDMIEDDLRTVALRLDSIWSLGLGAEWQWREDRALQFSVSYMDLGEAPVTTPEITGIGGISGKYTERDLWLFTLGVDF